MKKMIPKMRNDKKGINFERGDKVILEKMWNL